MSKEQSQVKNPASLYDCADLLQISNGRDAIPRSLMKGDIELLINTYMAQTQHTFKAFDAVWNALKFEHIHFACLNKDNRYSFMNGLYEAVFDKFAINVAQVKYGVIYALYFLFTTQPTTWPIHTIRVDIDRWTKLFDFYLSCCQSGSKEGAQAALIFRKMKDELMAFTFAADHKFETASILEQKEMETARSIIDNYHDLEARRSQNDATSSCYDSIANEFTALAQQYQKFKQQACMTPQATLVTQQWLKDTVNINETDQRKLQNVMLKGVLATDEEAFTDAVQEAGRRMWAARADYGLQDTDVMLPHRMPPRVYADKSSVSDDRQQQPQHQHMDDDHPIGYSSSSDVD